MSKFVKVIDIGCRATADILDSRNPNKIVTVRCRKKVGHWGKHVHKSGTLTSKFKRDVCISWQYRKV